MYATPYIFFNGNCAEALSYYGKVFGAHVVSSTSYGDTPAKDQFPKEMHDKVIHAVVMIGNTAVMASDDCTPNGAAGTHGGYSLSVSVDTPEMAHKVFDGLADGGTVTMAMDKTFFAAAFGAVHDRFGVRWMVICEKAH